MKDNLNFHWDKEEDAFVKKYKKNKSHNQTRNVEEYLKFLSEFEPSRDTLARPKPPPVRFTLPHHSGS